MKYKVNLLVVSALLVLENYQNTTYSIDNLILYNLMHECLKIYFPRNILLSSGDALGKDDFYLGNKSRQHAITV